MRITAAALLITAILNTSRGCTRIVSIVPMVTSWCPFSRRRVFNNNTTRHSHSGLKYGFVATCIRQYSAAWSGRSEEHTSDLQSLRHLVCRLLLVKDNK